MSRPPALAVTVVEALVADRALRDATLGDLAEDFERIAIERSPSAARAWYWSQVVRSSVPLALLAMRGGIVPWLRLVASVVLGYAVLAALVVETNFWLAARLGVATAWAMPVASLVVGVLCAVIAGWVVAWIGGRSPLFAALCLGAACMAISALLLAQGGDGSPMWYQIVLMLIVLPSVAGGALLRSRVTRHKGQTTPSSGKGQ